ncbi:thiamine-phosphate kinase [Virgibacillus sp. NKC19-3]|uniref:thiamine-phosphate kinase n=1 Tax=Virgibacillus saliphilus TaxID=2831674 RepID=UPI001C9B6BD0|nr:thiamine-phosphate kinase [Virgibacillus sp. NKC19-3]MBY7142401.1 thiamine-phosphate kinase [Virgibacillus sp. NKC19-3]
MDEFSFIESIKQQFYKQSTLLKGIGDDAAVFRQHAQDIVTAVDTFVEDVHFSKDTMEAFHVGYRALAANISDLAAMGATPAFYLVSIVIPKSWSDQELAQIFSGMKELASFYKMDLIGGDTVSGNELTLSVTVFGYVEQERARYRSTACAGDIVFVTGTLGDSQAGYHILTTPGDYTDSDYFIRRHQLPSPSVEFAKRLKKLSRVALNDISDGLASETAEIAEASQVTITLYDNFIPTSKSMQQFTEDLQHKWKLYGGEDFELLGTVSIQDWEIVKEIADETNTRISKIGYVTVDEDNGSVFLVQHNKRKRIYKRGYTHSI